MLHIIYTCAMRVVIMWIYSGDPDERGRPRRWHLPQLTGTVHSHHQDPGGLCSTAMPTFLVQAQPSGTGSNRILWRSMDFRWCRWGVRRSSEAADCRRTPGRQRERERERERESAAFATPSPVVLTLSYAALSAASSYSGSSMALGRMRLAMTPTTAARARPDTDTSPI